MIECIQRLITNIVERVGTQGAAKESLGTVPREFTFAGGFGWGGILPDSREAATLREEFTKTCCCEDKRGLLNE